MSRLALGTAQFGSHYGISNVDGQVDSLSAKAMIDYARFHSVDTIDTAAAYGNSEEILGEVGIHGLNIVTKLPSIPEDTKEVAVWIKGQVTNSLLRLGETAIYGLLLHRPEELLGEKGPEIYQSLQDLREAGHVKKIGVSIYSPDVLVELTRHYDFDLVQAPLSLIDRRFEESGWLQRLKKKGTEIHTRSTFLQGLLLMNPLTIPNKFSIWNEIWDKWRDYLRTSKVTSLQACLGYPLSLSGVDRVVVGADNKEQLKRIIKSEIGGNHYDFPNLGCVDERLINPANWSLL